LIAPEKAMDPKAEPHDVELDEDEDLTADEWQAMAEELAKSLEYAVTLASRLTGLCAEFFLQATDDVPN
jgi:hypothetical protein